MKEPVKQHIISKFYLRKFSTEDTIFVYNKSDDKVREAHIDSIFQNDFYTHVNKDESKDYDVEKWLAEIEEIAAPALLRYLKDGEKITPNDKSIISLFIASTYLRTRDMRNRYAECLRDEIHEQLYNAIRDTTLPPYPIPEKLTNLLLNRDLSGFILDIPQEETLNTFKYIGEIVELIFEMEWELIKAPDGQFFITGDTPVSFDPLQLAMPLSSSFYLFASKNRFKIPTLTINKIEEINVHTIRLAKREIYCEREDKNIESLIEKNKHIEIVRKRVGESTPTKNAQVNLVRKKLKNRPFQPY